MLIIFNFIYLFIYLFNNFRFDEMQLVEMPHSPSKKCGAFWNVALYEMM